MRSPGSVQSPSVCTFGDKFPSAAQPDPCGPQGVRCGLPEPESLAGNKPGGPVEEGRREIYTQQGRD